MIKPFQHKAPQLAASAYVDETAVVIGEVSIGDDSSIWPMAVVRGDIHQIIIGNRTNVQDGTIIHVTHAGEFNEQGFATHLGSDVIVGHRVILHGCTIHDFCLIGMGVTVMDGAVIHSNTVIGAGSLVPPKKELEGGFLYLGSPVKKIRKINSDEFNFIRYSANYYVELKNKYQKQQKGAVIPVPSKNVTSREIRSAIENMLNIEKIAGVSNELLEELIIEGRR